MMFSQTVRCLASLLVAGLLQGCISVFPKSEPAQLYRFGDAAPRTGEARSADHSFNVFLGDTMFNRAAAGERILTMTGTQAAYIKGARWVTSAQDLFDAALQQAFDNGDGRARLVRSGTIARSGYLLQLQVHAFEARYPDAAGAAPEILVALRATLADSDARDVVGERSFNAAIRADENRVGGIVAAFDLAVAQVLSELVDWVDAHGMAQDADENAL
jgi:cholesterol transport system auxiliary component